MTPAAAKLPDDVDALKAMILALAQKTAAADAEIAALKALNARADERIARLTSILKMLDRARYGKRSEKLKHDPLDEDQQAFVFDEIETGLSAIKAELDKAKGKAAGPRPARPRKGFAAHLERIEVVIEPEDPPGCEELEKVRIGEDVCERLDVVPAKFQVIVTRRPKYAWRGRDGVVQAPAPAHLIEAGIPTEALLAHIAVAKYADGLPLYRQEAIYARDGVDLDRSLTAQWMGRVGFELEPLADAILAHIKQGERIFADETTLPTLAPGSGKVKTAWLWAYARDDSPFGGSGPPMVAYRFEDSRGGDCVARHLAGYRGILQVDGGACPRAGQRPDPGGAYNRLAKAERADGAVTLAGCWSHVRRRFFELHASESSPFATRTVEAMAPLWQVEAEIRGHDPDRRRAARQERSAAIVRELFAAWERELPRLSGKSKLAEAIRYALHRRAVLQRFLDDGRIEIDSNIVERTIRPQAITRKNALFAGSDGGGCTWATIATVLTTAKLNAVDPFAWLKLTLERLAAGWPNRDIDALMPWNHHVPA
ncbi:IS66 family transposase [Consotaella aegiceratis]|uniref:IS66 family transposase n=1 Tax=Consotaella aegiceratis TaxID=3097961 RepID=UPI002F40DD99